MPAGLLESGFSAATLEAAERKGLVTVETTGRRVQVRLAHPLYGEVVRASCPVLRTRAVHRQLATALAGTGARRREDPLRLVTSQLESGGTGPPDLLVAGSRQAFALFDLSLAERVARAAVEAGAGIPGRRALAESLFAQGRFSEGNEVIADLHELVGTDSERAGQAEQEAFVLWMRNGRIAEAEAVLLEAESRISDPGLRDSLTSMRGTIQCLSGQTANAIATVSPVLERPGGNERACTWAAVPAALAWGLAGRVSRTRAVVDRWVDVARRLADERPFRATYMLAGKGRRFCWPAISRRQRRLQARSIAGR